MSLNDLTREAVLAAVAEYDAEGQEAFLSRHGFRPARAYLLEHGGRVYDSKAIAGVAHGYATGRPLESSEFSGGAATVGRALERLGFRVRAGSNPDWDWQEVVLACALVVDDGWRELRTGDPRVAQLSELLQRLPIHPRIDRAANFRSPDAVSRKTTDLATAHPDYQGKRTRGGKTDRLVVEQFIEQPAEMQAIAAAIREGAAHGDFDALPPSPMISPDEDASAEEGGLLARRHLARERNAGLRRKKIDQVTRRGDGLGCEICGFDFGQVYGPRGDGYIECHHVVPLHDTGARTTKLSDLILICANCHRMIHRRIPWLAPDELRAQFSQGRRSPAP